VLVRPGLAAPPLTGSVLMLLSGVAWGAYSVIGRAKTDGDPATPVEDTAGNFIRALPVVLIAAVPWYASMVVSPTGVTLAIVSGAITSGLGYVAWYAVLPSLSATKAAVLQLTVPLIAAGGGVLLLGEQVSLRFALAAVMILGGVALTLVRRPPDTVL
jgi:drug/metabolite transporter (DMT)-like permease